MDKVFQVIQENSSNTGNDSGISIIKIGLATGYPMPFINKCLDELEQNGEIYSREGINHNLYFAINYNF